MKNTELNSPTMLAVQIEVVCDAFDGDWANSGRPRIEEFLDRADSSQRVNLLYELIQIDCEWRRKAGEKPAWEDYEARFPDLCSELHRLIPQEVLAIKRAILACEETVTESPTDRGTASLAQVDTSVPVTSRTAPNVPQRVGDYELLREVGRGGMGVVYEARQRSLNRTVALKMILSGELAGEDAIRRFRLEAEAAAQLEHSGIVPVYEIGEDAGRHYFAMAFVDGISLQAKLGGGPLPPEEAARILQEVAEAVDAAHRSGIVHRDLKPHNILLDREGHPKITDFGLAKRIDSTDGGTLTGQLLGTPTYMAPEQAAGRIRDVGPRSDVYSLGAVLYATLTGRPPFQAATLAETLRQVIEREPVPPRDLNPAVPADLETICLKCLRKELDRRYDSAAALAQELNRFRRHEPILARPVMAVERAWRWCLRNRVVSTLTAIAVLLLLSVAMVSTIGVIRTRAALSESLWQQAQALSLAKERGWRDATLKTVGEGLALRHDDRFRDVAAQALTAWDWSVLQQTSLEGNPQDLVMSPDGRTIGVVLGHQLELRSLDDANVDRATERSPRRWSSPRQRPLTAVCFHPTEPLVACGDEDGHLHLVTLNASLSVVSYHVAGASLQGLAFGPEEGQFAATDGQSLKVLRISTGAVIFEDRLLPMRAQAGRAMGVHASRDEDQRLGRNVTTLAASSARRMLLAVSSLAAPRLWTFRDGKFVMTDLDRELPRGQNNRLALSGDGRFLFLACNEPQWGPDRIPGRLPPWASQSGGGRPSSVFMTSPPSASPEVPTSQPVEQSEPAPKPVPAKPPREIPQSEAAPPAPVPQQPRPERQSPNQNRIPPAAPQSRAPARLDPQPDDERQLAFAGEIGAFVSEWPVTSTQTSPDTLDELLLALAPPDGERRNPAMQSTGNQGLSKIPPDFEQPSQPQAAMPFERPISPVLSGPARRSTIYVFDLETLNRRAAEVPALLIGAVAGLGVSADNDTLLIAGSGGHLILYRWTDSELEQIGAWSGLPNPLRVALVSSQRCTLLAGANELHCWQLNGTRHSDFLRNGEPEWSKLVVDEPRQRLAVTGWGRPVEIRDLRHGRVLAQCDEKFVRELRWTHSGDRLLLVTPRSQTESILSDLRYLRVAAWSDPASNQTTLSEPFDVGFPVLTLAVSPDDQTCVVGGRNGGVAVLRLDGTTLHEIRTLGDDESRSVLSVSFSPDGRWLAAATLNEGIELWSTSDWTLRRRLDVPNATVNSLSFDSTGSRLVAGLSSREIRVWSLSDDKSVPRSIPTSAEVMSLHVASDGNTLAFGDSAGQVGLRDLLSGELLVQWKGHTGGAMQAVLLRTPQQQSSETDLTLLSSGFDGRIRTWQLGALQTSLETLKLAWTKSPRGDAAPSVIPSVTFAAQGEVESRDSRGPIRQSPPVQKQSAEPLP